MEKQTNPKDIVAGNKAPLHLLSFAAKVHWSLALAVGMFKYGMANYRATGAQASVYIAAAERHLERYKFGETYDPTDHTHNLGMVMACCSILLDAEHDGLLYDDRPPKQDCNRLLGWAEAIMQKLRTQYADRKPRHYTIADTEDIERNKNDAQG